MSNFANEIWQKDVGCMMEEVICYTNVKDKNVIGIYE